MQSEASCRDECGRGKPGLCDCLSVHQNAQVIHIVLFILTTGPGPARGRQRFIHRHNRRLIGNNCADRYWTCDVINQPSTNVMELAAWGYITAANEFHSNHRFRPLLTKLYRIHAGPECDGLTGLTPLLLGPHDLCPDDEALNTQPTFEAHSTQKRRQAAALQRLRQL